MLIYIFFAISLLGINILLITIVGVFYFLSNFLCLDIESTLNKVEVSGDIEISFGYDIDMKYNEFLKTEIPIIIASFESVLIGLAFSISYFDSNVKFTNFPSNILSLIFDDNPQSSSNQLFLNQSTSTEKLKCSDTSGVEINDIVRSFIIGILDGIAFCGTGLSIAGALINQDTKIETVADIFMDVTLIILWVVITFIVVDNWFVRGISFIGLGLGFLICSLCAMKVAKGVYDVCISP